MSSKFVQVVPSPKQQQDWKIDLVIRAFSCESAPQYRAIIISETGSIRVFDSVSQTWTLRHILTPQSLIAALSVDEPVMSDVGTSDSIKVFERLDGSRYAVRATSEHETPSRLQLMDGIPAVWRRGHIAEIKKRCGVRE